MSSESLSLTTNLQAFSSVEGLYRSVAEKVSDLRTDKNFIKRQILTRAIAAVAYPTFSSIAAAYHAVVAAGGVGAAFISRDTTTVSLVDKHIALTGRHLLAALTTSIAGIIFPTWTTKKLLAGALPAKKVDSEEPAAPAPTADQQRIDALEIQLNDLSEHITTLIEAQKQTIPNTENALAARVATSEMDIAAPKNDVHERLEALDAHTTALHTQIDSKADSTRVEKLIEGVNALTIALCRKADTAVVSELSVNLTALRAAIDPKADKADLDSRLETIRTALVPLRAMYATIAEELGVTNHLDDSSNVCDSSAQTEESNTDAVKRMTWGDFAMNAFLLQKSPAEATQTR